MFYREAGDFKTTYPDDSQTFPIKFDRWRYYAILAVAFGVVPFFINDYWANAVFVPFLIYAIAAIGLNILVGYCGQVSLGTGGFMAVGAYACYKLMTAFPGGLDPDPCASRGRDHGRGRAAVRPAVPADQGLLPRRRDAGGAVLPRLALQQGAVVLQLLGLGPDLGAGTHGSWPCVTGANDDGLGEVSLLPRDPLRSWPGSPGT